MSLSNWIKELTVHSSANVNMSAHLVPCDTDLNRQLPRDPSSSSPGLIVQHNRGDDPRRRLL